MEFVAAILWQRLDAAGHDASRLLQLADGWLLDGTANFSHAGAPCLLRYSVTCDARWRTTSATVAGWLGGAEVRLDIVRDGAHWLLNDVEQPLAAGCIDLDMAFTPATNVLPLRRLDFSTGAGVEAVAAYLRFPELDLGRLEQRYQRLDQSTYAYAAPEFDFAAELTVSEAGFVTDYPGLWRQAAYAGHE